MVTLPRVCGQGAEYRIMTGHNAKSEVLTGREVRRRRTPAEKLALIAETMEPGMTVSHVARRHGIAPNQLFAWRRLANEGALTATAAEDAVLDSLCVPAERRGPVGASVCGWLGLCRSWCLPADLIAVRFEAIDGSLGKWTGSDCASQ
jgi:hypothetical protein